MKFSTIKFYHVVVSIIFLTGLMLQFFFASQKSLTFEEAATWHVTKSERLLDVVVGNHSHQGDMPLTYVVNRIFIDFFDKNELGLRTLIIICNIISFWSVNKIVNKLLRGGSMKIIALIIFWFSPELTSVLFRSYPITMCLETIYMVVLLSYFKKQTRAYLFLVSMFLFLSLFSGFSAAYLIPATILFVFVQKNIINKLPFAFYAAIGIPSILFSVWIINYTHQPGYFLAIRNYVNYNNHNIINSLTDATGNWLGIMPWWNWTTGTTQGERDLNLIIREISSGALSTILILITIFKFQKHKDKLKHFGIDFLFCFLVVPWVLAIIFSTFFLNVIAHRLLLNSIILLPIGLALVINFIPKNNPYRIATRLISGFIIFICLVCISISNYINSSKDYFSFPKIYQEISETGVNQNDCIVISSYIASDFFEYYDHLYKKNILKDAKKLPMSSYLPKTIDDVSKTIDSNVCQKIYYLRWYDDPDGSLLNRAVMDHISNYSLLSSTYESGSTSLASLTIYIKK